MQLPERPNLRHIRDQAKDLVRSGAAPTLGDAQFQIARQYGFPNWPKIRGCLLFQQPWVTTDSESRAGTQRQG
jgi:hypothetical protein